MSLGTPLDTTKEWREGYAAAERDQSADTCPYAFHRTPYFPHQTGAFDREYRAKLDAWFAGWKANLDERGLGFNFKPAKKSAKR